MTIPYETRVGELHSLFKEVKSVPNASYFQSLIYLSQASGALNTKYIFKNSSSTIGKPHSPVLARDLLAMESGGYIRDTGSPDSLVLTSHEIKYKSTQKIKSKIIQKLRKLDVDDLITLSRIVKIEEKFQESAGSEMKELVKNISEYLLIPEKVVDNNLKNFSSIKEDFYN